MVAEASITLSLGDLAACSDDCGHWSQAWFIYIHVDKRLNTHKIKLKNSKKQNQSKTQSMLAIVLLTPLWHDCLSEPCLLWHSLWFPNTWASLRLWLVLCLYKPPDNKCMLAYCCRCFIPSLEQWQLSGLIMYWRCFYRHRHGRRHGVVWHVLALCNMCECSPHSPETLPFSCIRLGPISLIFTSLSS